MTPVRERESASPYFDTDGPDWSERSAFGTRGVPWWVPVLLAVLLTAIGTVVDISTSGKPGAVFIGCYIVGCLLGITLVQRKSVFAPIVQPPLVLAIVMPVVVLAAGRNIGGGTTAKLLAIAAPLITSFPAMGITTGAVLIIGLVRVFLQRPSNDELDTGTQTASRRIPTEEGRRRRARPAASERSAGRRQSPASDGSGRRRSSTDPRSTAARSEGRTRAQTPGRARAGEGTPERGSRAVPPGRGRQTPQRGGAQSGGSQSGGSQSGGAQRGGSQRGGSQRGRSQSGRSQSSERAEPPRRPRRPPREDFWD